jgi:hypothetical protein
MEFTLLMLRWRLQLSLTTGELGLELQVELETVS